jgi:hypothetical protein
VQAEKGKMGKYEKTSISRGFSVFIQEYLLLDLF